MLRITLVVSQMSRTCVSEDYWQYWRFSTDTDNNINRTLSGKITEGLNNNIMSMLGKELGEINLAQTRRSPTPLIPKKKMCRM